MTLKECFEKNGLSDLLDREKEEKLTALSKLLLEYNEKVNLTALKTEDEIYAKHLADCAFLVRYLRGGDLLDVGCGGGFPSLPVAILRPDVEVTAMDSTAKKLGFVRECSAALGLGNIKTLCGRAEELCRPPLRESFDAVTARAVAPLPALCELCLPYVKVGGAFYAMKTDMAELQTACRAAVLLGAAKTAADGYELICADGASLRCMMIFEKSKRTPDIYPRRYTQIKAKPL